MFAAAGRMKKALYVTLSSAVTYASAYGMRYTQEAARSTNPDLITDTAKDWQVLLYTICGPLFAYQIDRSIHVHMPQDAQLMNAHNRLKDVKISRTSDVAIKERLAREKISSSPCMNNFKIGLKCGTVITALVGLGFVVYPPTSITYAIISSVATSAFITTTLNPALYERNLRRRQAHFAAELQASLDALEITLAEAYQIAESEEAEPAAITVSLSGAAEVPLLASEHPPAGQVAVNDAPAASTQRLSQISQGFFSNSMETEASQPTTQAQSSRRWWNPFG